MKVLTYFALAILSIGLVACGGNKESDGSNEESIELQSNYSDEDSENSSDSEDWDAMLDSYEEYVDKYISCAKKASSGDMAALQEYASLMEKAQEISDKMDDAKDEMSASQWARYMKITNKMASAASQM